MVLMKQILSSDTYLIGLDLGTTNLKAVAISSDRCNSFYSRTPMQYLHNDDNTIKQFDGHAFYEQIIGLITQLILQLPENAVVAAISLSSASGNTVLIDKNNNLLYPVIAWQDTRQSTELAEALGDIDKELYYRTIGWPYIPTFPPAHLAWFKKHLPHLLEDAALIGMSSDYVNLKLCGSFAIDTSTATTLFLQRQDKAVWNNELSSKLGVNTDKLPKLLPCATKIGTLTDTAKQALGITNDDTAIVLGSFDHPSAARGVGVLEPGQLLISCGTSWVALTPITEREKILSLSMLCDTFLQKNGVWAGLFSVPNIAIKIDKYIETYIDNTADKYAIFDRLALKATAGACGLLINPLIEKSSYDLQTQTPENIARALMEGVGYLIRHELEKLQKGGIIINSAVMAGGPSEHELWPQIVCDINNITLKTPVNSAFAGAIGAAVMAGIGVGIYDDEYTAAELNNDFIIRTPNKVNRNLYDDEYMKWLKLI